MWPLDHDASILDTALAGSRRRPHCRHAGVTTIRTSGPRPEPSFASPRHTANIDPSRPRPQLSAGVPINPKTFPQPSQMAKWLGKLQNSQNNFKEPIQRGFCADQVRLWSKYFKRDQIRVVLSEEMYADPQRQIASVFNFVGVPPFRLDLAQAAEDKRPNAEDKRPNRKKKKSKACMSRHFTTEDRQALATYYRHMNRDLAGLLGIELPW